MYTHPSRSPSLEFDWRRVTLESVARVNRKLLGLQPWERTLFWLVRHGALRGSTAAEALREGRLERVAEHADAWAAERRPPT